MQRGFSLMIETFTAALVLVVRARLARKAARRKPVPARIRSPYKYN